ncbi:hypothetical protein [Brevibacillus sp. HD1.4A]|uniref:hypothetical protein n=1 Tax=Brevibacillus sp. HD1.4A TaxID=2738978 RepID=UPI001C2C6543|nr:hypothetical protein [Brevibacillus sp. HD1.4A]
MSTDLTTVDQLKDRIIHLENWGRQYREQNVAVLGDGQVFVKRTEDGLLKCVKGRVDFAESKGELAVVSGKAMVTAKGYYKANQLAGISIITPEKLTLPDGGIVVNPYPIIDAESGTISKVWVKKLAIGYSPTGNLVITSATLLYDVNMYFIQDLIKKVKKNAEMGRVCLEAGVTEEEKKKGGFYKIEGQFGIWVDYNQKDTFTAIETFIQKKLFAERNAQSICERLVLSKHPALAFSFLEVEGPENKRKASVPVIGFVNDFTRKQLMDMAAQAERGEEVTVNGRAVEVIETTATATAEDIATEDDHDEFTKDEVEW